MSYAQSFDRLLCILEELRAKCPWDKKQTIHTLRAQTIEELYELTEAISNEDWSGIKEELGDLLLHIVFYSKIGQEQNQFTIGEVIESLCNKLVSRHPHIYSTVQVSSEEEVKRNWEKLKLKEGRTSVLGGIPKGLPAMVKALSLQEKSKQVGFEWKETEQVYEKVTEEMEELQEAIVSGQQSAIEEEFGDLLFSLVNYSRFLKIDPEAALERTNKKFRTRFELMEQQVSQLNKQLSDLSLEEMDAIWNDVKQKLKTEGK